MKTSAAGRTLIRQREGCKLAAYRDPRGIPTIGVGHVDMTPPKTTMGMRITMEEADAYLAADLAPVERVINTAITLPVAQNEFDALASLGFNIGAGGLRRSLTVRRLNRGDVRGAAAAFMNWAHPASLAGRRRQEMAQFLTGNDADVAADRVVLLAHRLTERKASAQRTAGGGTAVAATGALAALTLPVAHHGHLAWWIGGLAAVGAVIDGAVAWSHLGAAKLLAANALAQAVPIAPPAAVAASAAPSVLKS